MRGPTTRRQFLRAAAAAAALPVLPRATPADQSGSIPPLIRYSGRPKQRGRAYGRARADDIRSFLDREIHGAFVSPTINRDELLRYAAACGAVIAEVTPVIHAELEGIAEGSGIRYEELVLLSLHEELYHRGALPKVPHCTAVAIGPPHTRDGATLVGQTWDWMESVYGLSSIVEWRRAEGPSVLAYGYPGLWAGAGLNDRGIALCWTSADLGKHELGVRVGLPSYALLTHLLYQDSLAAVEEEARRDRHAGWFTFVMADAEGNLLNVEGSPSGVTVERSTGLLARVGFGTRERAGGEPSVHPRCRAVADQAARQPPGTVSAATLGEWFAEPSAGISVGRSTIDMMVFDCTGRTAHLSRGPAYGTDWKAFRFGDD